ncbi:uncharacterized protein TRIADDRAFT_26273 [Trichoplax adhaerens]|uniref:Fucosyltransferase n=1 Tax=Trichoplax adhaerens TaxID=10228 RepID=B3RZS5_TRIAD|nr:hypothetical protein TRIADDRAFT_26273 [Trichoplax adhaerens]EDV24257.1 hypothetical protein TRIADDRAFT_26273 [Trichoplax adhaerens]|eukprot:XP_002113783.1 hypothetical protein TRIADDRAFT_26273 [Trichoplax adhaerens]
MLAWTTWFGLKWPYNNGIFHCGSFTCEVTLDKNRLKSSDALLFHGAEASMKNKNMFPKRDAVSPRQLWVYHSYENPVVTHGVNIQSGIYPFHNNIFNIIMTYTKDSDIPTCYGGYGKSQNRNPFIKTHNYAKGKNKLIAWVSSGCYTGRLTFVQQLAQYLPIDIYGKCGNLSCPRNDSCWEKLSSQYKFYLSFENFVCRDYITEKYYKNSLGRRLVPIVVSGANLQDETVAPPNSYINVFDFKTVEDLADYIQLVGSNDTLYNSYFHWKASYKDQGRSCDMGSGMCTLCANLHNDTWVTQKSRTIPDFMHRWGLNKDNCIDYGDVFIKNVTTGQVNIMPHPYY